MSEEEKLKTYETLCAITDLKTIKDSVTICKSWTNAINMAISALERRVPEKPLKHEWTTPSGYGYYDYTCPVCGKEADKYSCICGEEYKFCPYCGQAIDWEGTDCDG